MKIFHRTPYCQSIQPAALTIGNFDGFHRGHQAIISRLKTVAQEQQLSPSVMLFEPQPAEFFQKDHCPARLSRLADKLMLLQDAGIEQVIILPFTQQLAELSAESFIEKILLAQCHTKYLLIGDDFHFGHQRRGDFALLQQYQQKNLFQLEQVPTFTLANERVSSTSVRHYLAQADFKAVEALLGRPYTISGYVVAGQQRGRLLSFPTANIALSRKVTPLQGVFIVTVRGIAKNVALPAVANIGCRPTVDGQQYFLEVHLLDFAQDLYGKKITVEFLKKIRDEKKFASLDELRMQIAHDVEEARQFFA